MLAVFLLCAAFALSGTEGRLPFPPGVRRHCLPRWSAHGSRCFNFISSPRTWADAEKYCLQFDAHLASIHSLQENHFVQDLVRRRTGGFPEAWIGGNDAVEPFLWLWTDGSKFDFQGWGSGQPDNAGGREFCLHINGGDINLWNDFPCNLQLPFVCAKELSGWFPISGARNKE